MRALIIVISILLGIAGLLLIGAAFLPAQYAVIRSVEIAKPQEAVFSNLDNFSGREQWDPWIAADTAAVNTITGPVNGVGACWSWESAVLGNGSLTIETVEPSAKIGSKLVFTAPRAMQAEEVWMLAAIENGTQVTWTISGKLAYPVERYLGLFMNKKMGLELEKGLANLKQAIESQAIEEPVQ